MPLYLRYPAWATAGVKLSVNGKAVEVRQQPGSYITLERSWRNGDSIEMSFPMQLGLMPANDNPNVAAIAYGPILLAGAAGTKNMKGTAPFHDPADPYQYYSHDYAIPDDVPHVLPTGGKPVSAWLTPVAGRPLTFQAKTAAGKTIRFEPYYSLHLSLIHI